MKKIAVLLVLLTSFYLFAMSNDSTEEPKDDPNKLTKDELHRIATNYYKFVFEEEHEWKGMARKEDEDLIRSIIAITSEGITISYMVNFNPDGHVMILGYKSLVNIIDMNGSGHWTVAEKEGSIDLDDRRLPLFLQDHFAMVKDKIIKKQPVIPNPKINSFQKFNVPIEDFKEKAQYEDNTYQPDWWLEKKKASNQLYH